MLACSDVLQTLATSPISVLRKAREGAHHAPAHVALKVLQPLATSPSVCRNGRVGARRAPAHEHIVLEVRAAVQQVVQQQHAALVLQAAAHRLIERRVRNARGRRRLCRGRRRRAALARLGRSLVAHVARVLAAAEPSALKWYPQVLSSTTCSRRAALARLSRGLVPASLASWQRPAAHVMRAQDVSNAPTRTSCSSCSMVPNTARL